MILLHFSKFDLTCTRSDLALFSEGLQVHCTVSGCSLKIWHFDELFTSTIHDSNMLLIQITALLWQPSCCYMLTDIQFYFTIGNILQYWLKSLSASWFMRSSAFLWKKCIFWFLLDSIQIIQVSYQVFGIFFYLQVLPFCFRVNDVKQE